jgi:long-chain acyl-CoA synthetase
MLVPGAHGEIAVRGPNLFKGYWRSAEDPFVDGFFLTGDIGTLDEQGMLHIVDRKKDMILSGGFNVYPTMIEAAIYEHEAVEECIVIGVPDAYRGQAAKAFIKLRAGTEAFSLEALRAFLDNKLGRHELPSALEFRDALPKTPVGKLSKKELKQEAAF